MKPFLVDMIVFVFVVVVDNTVFSVLAVVVIEAIINAKLIVVIFLSQ